MGRPELPLLESCFTQGRHTLIVYLLIFPRLPRGKGYRGESGIDPQDFGGFGPRLLFPTHHRVRASQPHMNEQVIGTVELECLLVYGLCLLVLSMRRISGTRCLFTSRR